MQMWSIRYYDGSYGPLVSRDVAERARDGIDPAMRHMCTLTTWTEGTREQIVAEWLREKIRDRLATCGYTEDVIAFERALELITVGPFPEIEAAKLVQNERMRRIGAMLADPESPTLPDSPRSESEMGDGRGR